jgi:membrane protein YdbS with pleckstrin-like domain
MAEQKPDEKVYFLDKPDNVARLLKVFYVICFLLFAADFVLHRHTTHDWEQLPGFYAIFGFVAFVMLVLVAKLMRKLLMRKEDYYDVDD